MIDIFIEIIKLTMELKKWKKIDNANNVFLYYLLLNKQPITRLIHVPSLDTKTIQSWH